MSQLHDEPQHDFSTLLKILSTPSDLEALSNQSIQHDLGELVETIRQHLDMDVAFLSRLKHGFRKITEVNKRPGSKVKLDKGHQDPEEITYCRMIVDKKLPSVIADTREHPITSDLQLTEELNIGSYIGVPVILSGGQVYGTLCCFKEKPDDTLSKRDVSILTLLASFTARHIEKDMLQRDFQKQVRREVSAIINENLLSTVLQPIYDCKLNKIVGFECLARFDKAPYQPPNYWFDSAAQGGYGELLELYAIEVALQALPTVPQDCFLSLNISPQYLYSGRLHTLLMGIPLERIVLEVTEREAIDHYEDFRRNLQPLREQGLRLAVDDAGAGFASFQHILELQADIIKLDQSLICNLDQDQGRRALVAALIGFAAETNCLVLGEGVETPNEMSILQRLGAHFIQGYYLSHPLPLEQAITFFHAHECIPETSQAGA